MSIYVFQGHLTSLSNKENVTFSTMELVYKVWGSVVAYVIMG